jgi:protein involved in polysaccharide export with SLBB domain
MAKGALTWTYFLQPNDYLYVPMSPIATVYVFGEVGNPGAIRIGPRTSLGEALFNAGAF